MSFDRFSASSTSAPRGTTPRRRVGAQLCMVCGAGLLLWSLVPLVMRKRPAEAPSSSTSAVAGAQGKAPSEAAALTLAAKAGKSSKALRKASRSEQAQIKALYEDWKNTWKSGNIEKCMSFYAPTATMREGSSGNYDRSRIRTWLVDVWRDGLYTVTSSNPIGMYSDGRRVTFIVSELYRHGQRVHGSASFNSRFVWQKQAARHNPKQPSWLIVEQSYLSTDIYRS